MSVSNKICFVLDTYYPNYTARLKTTSLKNFIDLKLADRGFGFLISTNRPEDFEEYKSDSIKVYHVDELRKDNETSLKYELLPEDPTGLYPSKFPWNIERFVLKKAGELGYNIVINLDSDVIIHDGCDGEYIENYLNQIFEANTVVTNQGLYIYNEGTLEETFHLHNDYKCFFKLNREPSDFITLDGPVIIYMGETSKDIMRYADTWDMLTNFGYKKEYGFGYENIVCGIWSICIPMTDFKLKWKELPFTPHHKYEDRY